MQINELLKDVGDVNTKQELEKNVNMLLEQKKTDDEELGISYDESSKQGLTCWRFIQNWIIY